MAITAAQANLSAYGQPMDLANTTRRAYPTFTGPASYTSGGEEGLAAVCRMGRVYTVLGVISNGTAIRVPYWNNATEKLMWFVPNTGAEASGDLSGYVGTLEVIGT